MMKLQPTSLPELNAVLHELVSSVQAVLGANFIAAYLQGSFAVGDWDENSDVDLMIVIDQDLMDDELPALQAIHARIYDLDSAWAQHLEGSYFPQALLRHVDPAKTPLLYLDNGSREVVRSTHDNNLVVRWVTRECGITLAGSEPTALIDPVAADDLRREVRATMHTWTQDILATRYTITNRWAQPFVVLGYCRILHTLGTGRIESKLAGAEWAKRTLDARWTGLIEGAWAERPNTWLNVHQPADPVAVADTLEFIRYALDTRRVSDEWLVIRL